MIDEVLVILKEKLNNYFRQKAKVLEDKVIFLEGSKTESISFPENNVVPLLMNIEEEKTLRLPNRYEGLTSKGMKTTTYPPVCINLSVLFVCKFSDYLQSLKFLSLIVRFFQRNPVLDRTNTPALNPEIEKLKIELVTLPISQQNELWNSLRTTYLPSVYYKVSLLEFHDEESGEGIKEIEEIRIKVSDLET